MARGSRRFRRQDTHNTAAVEIEVTLDPPENLAAALTFLALGEIIACEPIAWGSNYSFAVALRHAEEQRLAVYKPRRREVPLWDFPDGTLYRREYASSLVPEALGWASVPPMGIRDGPYAA